jgi:hypothetical protein
VYRGRLKLALDVALLRNAKGWLKRQVEGALFRFPRPLETSGKKGAVAVDGNDSHLCLLLSPTQIRSGAANAIGGWRELSWRTGWGGGFTANRHETIFIKANGHARLWDIEQGKFEGHCFNLSHTHSCKPLKNKHQTFRSELVGAPWPSKPLSPDLGRGDWSC